MYCSECGIKLYLGIIKINRSYYIGYICNHCGCHSTESSQLVTKESAEQAYDKLFS